MHSFLVLQGRELLVLVHYLDYIKRNNCLLIASVLARSLAVHDAVDIRLTDELESPLRGV